MEIGGIPIHLVDTAGMRSGGDHVEQLGVERSIKAMEQADLVLAVFDLSTPWDEADRRLLESLDPGRSIMVANKSDLLRDTRSDLASADAEHDGLRAGRVRNGASGPEVLPKVHEMDSTVLNRCVVSALKGHGLDDLRGLIQQVITGGLGLHLEEPVLATERQRVLVSETLDSTESALAGALQHRDEELVCEDLRAAAQALGRMTGEDLTPDLLDEIFSRFCLGK